MPKRYYASHMLNQITSCSLAIMTHLLKTVEALDQSSLCSLLLPLLDAQSARSLALTCKHLRDLCYLGRTSLKFARGGAIRVDAERFPSCSSISYTIVCDNDAATHLPALLPLVARFKQLSTAALTFKTHIKQQTEVLQSLNTHLSRLTALHIHMDFKESCYGEGDWCAIGTCSGLQQLSVKFRHPQKGYIPFCAGHLSALAPLKDTLQHLHIDADVADCEAHSIMDWSPLKDLKQLTYLSLVTGRGTSAVGSCTKLSVLQLQLYNPLHRLGPEFSLALQQLVHLTELRITHQVDIQARHPPHLWQALQHLTALQSLQLLSFSPLAANTALSSLTQLTCLKGPWIPDLKSEEQLPEHEAQQQQQQQQGRLSGAFNTTICPSVGYLSGTGLIPFFMFPGLVTYEQDGMIAPSVLTELANNCTKLQQLLLSPKTVRQGKPASLACAHIADRVAAIQKLAGLRHLQCLEFSANSDCELAALVELKQIKELLLLVPTTSNCRVQALMLLNELGGLQKLELRLTAFPHRALTHSEMQMLIRALCRIRSVVMRVSCKGVVIAAWQALVDAGLPVPVIEVLGLVSHTP